MRAASKSVDDRPSCLRKNITLLHAVIDAREFCFYYLSVFRSFSDDFLQLKSSCSSLHGWGYSTCNAFVYVRGNVARTKSHPALGELPTSRRGLKTNYITQITTKWMSIFTTGLVTKNKQKMTFSLQNTATFGENQPMVEFYSPLPVTLTPLLGTIRPIVYFLQGRKNHSGRGFLDFVTKQAISSL